MVARAQNFVCQSCGAASARWSGRCDACGAWNTLVEEGAAARQRSARKGRLFAVEPLKGEAHEAPRLGCGITEFDRVTGGGLVRGSVLLLGGDPGIGKSTLLIEVAAAFARHGQRAVYISGEEAVAQVRLRAERLGLAEGVVEHMVDAVLSFEGEGSQQFRILRAIKNRFGPTDEIGVFEMTGSGLREV